MFSVIMLLVRFDAATYVTWDSWNTNRHYAMFAVILFSV